MNLSANAAHAMREMGGLLKIELSDTDLDSSFIEQHPYLSAGTYIKLQVSDTGHGLEKKIADRIFEEISTILLMEVS